MHGADPPAVTAKPQARTVPLSAYWVSTPVRRIAAVAQSATPGARIVIRDRTHRLDGKMRRALICACLSKNGHGTV